MSVVLTRHLGLETFQLEQFSTIDDQGAPAYLTPVNVQGRILRQDKTVVMGDGTEKRTVLTIWVPNTEPVLPDDKDRITWSGLSVIVAEVKDVKSRLAVREHRRVRCRRE